MTRAAHAQRYVPRDKTMSKRHYGLDAELNLIAHTIKDGIRHFKRLNECGDYSQVMTWVIGRSWRVRHVLFGITIFMAEVERPYQQRPSPSLINGLIASRTKAFRA